MKSISNWIKEQIVDGKTGLRLDFSGIGDQGSENFGMKLLNVRLRKAVLLLIEII